MTARDYINRLSKEKAFSIIESSGYLQDNLEDLKKIISELRPLHIAKFRKYIYEMEHIVNYIEDNFLSDYFEKYFENITDRDIQNLCWHLGIRASNLNYKLNKNKTVNITGNFDYGSYSTTWREYIRIPLKINKIDGIFTYNSIRLNSFVGFPKEFTNFSNITGNFKSLEGFPIVNFTSVSVTSHSLKSIKGLRGSLEKVTIVSDSLVSLEGLPEQIREITIYNCPKLSLLTGLHENITIIADNRTPIYLFMQDFKDDLEFLLHDIFIEQSENQNEKPNLYYKLYVAKLKYIGKRISKLKLKKLEEHYNIVY